MKTRAIIRYDGGSGRGDRIWLRASIPNRRIFWRNWKEIGRMAANPLIRRAFVDVADVDYDYINRFHLIRKRGWQGRRYAYYRLADVEACLRLEFAD